MHRFLAAAAVLGLLGLPMLASAQSTNQPSTKKETSAKPVTSTKKAAEANATRKAANKGSMKRHAKLAKKKRYATAKHGKHFTKSHSQHRHAVGSSAAKGMHRASAKSRTPHARSAVSDQRTSIQRRAAYRAASAPTQRSCGQFMYWKDGKCNDARNKAAK